MAANSNRAPVAVDDKFSLYQRDSIYDYASRGGGRDYDPDGDTVYVSSIGYAGYTKPATDGGTTITGKYGTLTIYTHSYFSYNANLDARINVGDKSSDVFEYAITDNRGGTDTGKIVFDVFGADIGDYGANTFWLTGSGHRASGEFGDDTYIIDDTQDLVIENSGDGIDTIRSSISITALAINVENLVLTGATGLFGTGNGLDNTITGNTGNNVLDGRGGSDTLIGGLGNDTYLIDRAIDTVIEKGRQGTDTVKASTSYTLATKQEIEALRTVADTATTAINLTGNELANTITGNAGINVINGGLGNDILKGGAGRDTFVFDTRPTSGNIDHITDFRAVDDTIRLENAIFTALTKTGTIKADAFALIASETAVVDPDAHILYEKATGTLYYDANGGSSSGRVAFAVLDNHASLTFQDFSVA